MNEKQPLVCHVSAVRDLDADWWIGLSIRRSALVFGSVALLLHPDS